MPFAQTRQMPWPKSSESEAYRRSDIVMVDNHRIGHGREIYLGPKASRLTLGCGWRIQINWRGILLYTVTTVLKSQLSLNRSRTLVLLSYVNLWNFKLCSWSGIAVGNSCWKMERMPNPKCLDFTGDFCAKDLHCLVRSLSSILARYAWENLRCSGGMLNYRKLEAVIYSSILSLCYILLEELDGKI